jgi:hypothetical protein
MQWETLPRFDCVVCGKSAYPPRLSVIADMPISTLSAMRRPEQVQQCVWTKLRYSITSSASASSDGGTVRPSILAVW